jgi:stage V sporulation protein B
MLLIFAFPVVITGLAELALFDFVGNFVVGIYMASEYVGYYGAATPIARLPLIISMAVATTVLPAAAEAAGLNDRNLLKGYLNQSFRYVTLLVLPMSVGIMIFAAPIMKMLYILPAYMNGAGALQILAIGMMFFTIYTVSSSIAQGLGKPYLPMVILTIGSIIDVALNIYLVPIYGINGAAIATTITALMIMVVIVWKTLQISEVELHFRDLGRIVLATGIMGGLLLLVPQSLFFMSFPLNYLLFFAVMVLAGIIYMVALILVGGLKNSDIRALRKLNSKSGPLKAKLGKIISLIERYAH